MHLMLEAITMAELCDTLQWHVLTTILNQDRVL